MSKNKNVIMNDDIVDVEKVRCSIDGGDNLGIISIDEAFEKSNELDLDLVLIAPNATPPVAKIMNYGKFKYQEDKKKKENNKKQTKIDVKEIKFSINIADNDISYKVKNIIKFLSKGKHVKIRVFIKGREMSNTDMAKDVLYKVWNLIKDYGIMENKPKLEGRFYNMLVIPQ